MTESNKTLDDYAVEYRTSSRTLKRYREQGAPLHDFALMLQWVKGRKITNGMALALHEFAKAQGSTWATPKPEIADATEAWEKFKSRLEKGADGNQVNRLEWLVDYYYEKVTASVEADNDTGVAQWNKLYLDAFDTLRQQKLAADKLGIEEGQLFAKDELARIFRAWAFWSMRGVDADLAELCPKLVGVTSVAEVRASLEPWLLSTRFVKPFARASRIESESALAPWIAAEIKDAVDDFIEDGAKEFDAS